MKLKDDTIYTWDKLSVNGKFNESILFYHLNGNIITIRGFSNLGYCNEWLEDLTHLITISKYNDYNEFKLIKEMYR